MIGSDLSLFKPILILWQSNLYVNSAKSVALGLGHTFVLIGGGSLTTYSKTDDS